MKRGDIMLKTFVLPMKQFEAEVFNNSENTWRTLVISAHNEHEALQKIYEEMSDNDILLKVRNERGYLI